MSYFIASYEILDKKAAAQCEPPLPKQFVMWPNPTAKPGKVTPSTTLNLRSLLSLHIARRHVSEPIVDIPNL